LKLVMNYARKHAHFSQEGMTTETVVVKMDNKIVAEQDFVIG